MWGASVLFWSSWSFVLYTYVGYPLLIRSLAKLRPAPAHHADIEPSVSVVLAAHDEQATIAAKLENLLALEYPKDKLQIIVVSDGSTDRTDQIVRSYSERGVVLLGLETPSGKPSALNRGVAQANGEVILFCDARQTVEADALRALVRHFADARVGAVSGALHIPSEKGPGLYWKYEKAIRAAEGAFDSVVGATGALYAIRRCLFQELPQSSLLDDLYTPMQIRLQGYRVLFEVDARAHDVEASTDAEFARKARTLAGNFQILEQLPGLLSPRSNPLWFQFVSHKLARLACPYALIALFGSNLGLATLTRSLFYRAVLAGQVAAYGAAAAHTLSAGRAGRVPRLCHTFVVLNAAAVAGLRRYLAGNLAWTSARKR